MGDSSATLESRAMTVWNIKNKSPFAYASGDWLDLNYLSTSKASPNDLGTVIVVIIVIGKVN